MLGEKETLEHVRYACAAFSSGALTWTDGYRAGSFDSGINTFDTANAYSNGESERLLGKALKHHKIPREEVVILTKVCCNYFDAVTWG
jgi:aryl-alcohol dehydrogenase-like predicted oxidoreductase